MQQTQFLGIGFGLAAAFCQSLSYLSSRLFIKHHNDNTVSLLALSHIIMGTASLPLAVFLWPQNMPKITELLPNIIGVIVSLLIGQLFFFAATIHSQPSRLSSLMGLKVFMLSVIGVVFFQQSFGPAKWLAVLFCTVSVFLMSYSGKQWEIKPVVLGVLAGLSFCITDINIKSLVNHLSFMGSNFRAATLATALCYIICGFIGVVIIALKPGHSTRQTWLYAIPFAVCWLMGMILLYSCFGLIGVVFGNIIQSLRGIISIVLGFVVAHTGFEKLEPKATKRMIALRIIAALLMISSVALFVI